MHYYFGIGSALLLVAVGSIAVPVRCFTTTVPSVLPHNALRCNPSFARPARPRELQNCGRVGIRAFEEGANGVDPTYPYLFDGRLWFRPAIVRVSQQLPDSIRPLSLFGFSIGAYLLMSRVFPAPLVTVHFPADSLIDRRCGEFGI
jgi:hypothetical protein